MRKRIYIYVCMCACKKKHLRVSFPIFNITFIDMSRVNYAPTRTLQKYVLDD